MIRDSDTQANFIKWYKNVFGFSNEVATALHDDQLFKDALTIAEFGDSEIDSVCQTLRRDSSLPIAELAVTRLKLLTFWVRHQHHTNRAIGGTSNPLVRIELNSSPAMGAHERPLFNELLRGLVTLLIFVCC